MVPGYRGRTKTRNGNLIHSPRARLASGVTVVSPCTTARASVVTIPRGPRQTTLVQWRRLGATSIARHELYPVHALIDGKGIAWKPTPRRCFGQTDSSCDRTPADHIRTNVLLVLL